MSFGFPDFGAIPGATVVLSNTPVSAATELPTSTTQLAVGSVFSAGANFTYNGQNIVSGHIYMWNGTNFIDQGQVANFVGNLSVSGSITAGTGVTATTGNLTATNGNLVLGTAGNKIQIPAASNTTAAGANAAGTVTLVAGTATVATTAVTANSIIKLTRMSIGATGAAALGQLTIGTVTAGTSFVINSVQAGDATAIQASDVSIVGWEILN